MPGSIYHFRQSGVLKKCGCISGNKEILWSHMTRLYRPYTRLAEIYDLKGHDRFSIQMVEYTFRLLKQLHFRPRKILDLCCGTGTAAIIFTEQGYEVTGLDGSREMLAVARSKALKKRVSIKFVHQRLPHFDIMEMKNQPVQFDLITCYFDSLNYILKEDELRGTFVSAARHLRPGGLLIFDMNTASALKNLWGDKIYSGIKPGIAWIWESLHFEKAHQADLRTTCFVKKGKHWEMFEEIHTEKTYSNRTIRKGLRSAGFEVVKFYECMKFRGPTRKSFRIAVVARKK